MIYHTLIFDLNLPFFIIPCKNTHVRNKIPILNKVKNRIILFEFILDKQSESIRLYQNDVAF